MREWSTSGRREARRPEGAVLLVDADAGTRRAFAGEIRGLGLPVVDVSSPLEAIDALDRASDGIDTVIVAPTIQSTPQAELARFILESYPDVAQVLVRGQHWHEGKADHRWLLFDLQGELVGMPRGGRPSLGARRRYLATGSGSFRAVKPPRAD